MANYTAEQWNAIKIEIMEKCYNSFAELGLHGTGMWEMAKYCGYNTSKIYTYYDTKGHKRKAPKSPHEWGAGVLKCRRHFFI